MGPDAYDQQSIFQDLPRLKLRQPQSFSPMWQSCLCP